MPAASWRHRPRTATAPQHLQQAAFANGDSMRCSADIPINALRVKRTPGIRCHLEMEWIVIHHMWQSDTVQQQPGLQRKAK